MKPRRAFTLVELLTVMMILSMLMAVLVPALGRSIELVRRIKCQKQLENIGQALLTYATDRGGGDLWPCTDFTATGKKIDTMGSLWMLVRFRYLAVDNFVCPSDESDQRATAYRGAIDQDKVSDPFPLQDNKPTLSYSYQIPHAANPGKDRPNPTRFPVMADRNPFDPPPTAPEGKLLSAVRGVSDQTGGPAMTNAIIALNAEARKGVNSINHRGEGQMVLYRDGHADWRATPLAGVDFDNIYTLQSDNSLSGRAIGQTPDDSSLPTNPDDACLRTLNAPVATVQPGSPTVP